MVGEVRITAKLFAEGTDTRFAREFELDCPSITSTVSVQILSDSLLTLNFANGRIKNKKAFVKFAYSRKFAICALTRLPEI